MKFKNKDGNVFEDIDQVREKYCAGRDCDDCKVWCRHIVRERPAEAARLMGYEVVEETKTANLPNPRKCDRCGRMFIADYPQYLCPECDEALEKQCAPEQEPIQKPLRDWTLGEVKEYCFAEDRDCETCFIFSEKNDRCRLWNDKFASPCSWDLTDPPRFTEQEVADAKALMRLHKEQFDSIRRAGGVLALMNKDSWAGSINVNAFPSIAQGETVKLSEIVGEEE